MAHFDMQAFIDEKMLEEMQRLVDENSRLHSWDGIMSVVNEVYPATVFDGSSGDIGAQMVVLLREVDRMRKILRELADKGVLWVLDDEQAALDAAGGAE